MDNCLGTPNKEKKIGELMVDAEYENLRIADNLFIDITDWNYRMQNILNGIRGEQPSCLEPRQKQGDEISAEPRFFTSKLNDAQDRIKITLNKTGGKFEEIKVAIQELERYF